MSVVSTDPGVGTTVPMHAPATEVSAPLTRTPSVWRTVLCSPAGAIGFAIVALHLALAIVGPWLVPHDIATQDSAKILHAPTAAHWFGTDRLGRDVFSRTMVGGQAAILISTLATLAALIWGTALGVFVALMGGRTDQFVMRTVDAASSLPWILVVMLFVAAFGLGYWALILVLGFSYGLSVVYVARAAALDFVTRDFVLAAQARGETRATVMYHEILPNIRDSLAVQAVMQWSWIMLGISSLSYLGFGVSPPTPDWGLMVGEARGLLVQAPWVAAFPMIALSSLIIAANLAADALAKALGVDRNVRGLT